MSATATSSRKAAANRRNARKSTGPVTAEGKARSSRNAITHGIFCQENVLPGECSQSFKILERGLLESLKPRNMLEVAICDRIVTGYWKLQRIGPAEAQLMQQLVDQDQLQAIEAPEEQLEELRRDFHSARERLARPRSNKEQYEQEFEQAREALETAEKQLYERIERPAVEKLMARLIRSDKQSLEKLSRYEQRIENAIHRNLKQLREMRKVRGEEMRDGEMREEENEMQNEATENATDDNACEKQELSSVTIPPLPSGEGTGWDDADLSLHAERRQKLPVRVSDSVALWELGASACALRFPG